MDVLATINIGMNPDLIDAGQVVLSWHGFLTFIAVALSVFLVARWGTREGMVADSIYSVAVWCIVGGVVGARVLHIIDRWEDTYQHNPEQIVYIWRGGITIYGAILGGFVGGALYIMIRNAKWYLAIWGRYFRFLGEAREAPLPGIGHLADVATPALLISMAIGRIGDIINGEHFANTTDLAWGVVYTHPDSPGFGRPATHPAVAYELLMDLAILAVLWPLRHRLRPSGMFFALYLATYSVGRFFLNFLRIDNEYLGGLNEAQIIALVVIVITIPLLVYKAQFVRPPQSRAASRRQGR